MSPTLHPTKMAALPVRVASEQIPEHWYQTANGKVPGRRDKCIMAARRPNSVDMSVLSHFLTTNYGGILSTLSVSIVSSNFQAHPCSEATYVCLIIFPLQMANPYHVLGFVSRTINQIIYVNFLANTLLQYSRV